MRKNYCIVCDKYRKFKNPKISCFLKKKKKTFLLFVVSVAIKIKRHLKKKNQLRFNY